jgi:hypothetical protein
MINQLLAASIIDQDAALRKKNVGYGTEPLLK